MDKKTDLDKSRWVLKMYCTIRQLRQNIMHMEVPRSKILLKIVFMIILCQKLLNVY